MEKEYQKNKSRESYLRNKEKIKLRTKIRMDQKRYNGQRTEILERDNFECQDCGMNQEQHILIFGRGLTIDHKDGQGRKSKNPNNNPDNLITLCLRCHGRKDSARSKKMEKGESNSGSFKKGNIPWNKKIKRGNKKWKQ